MNNFWQCVQCKSSLEKHDGSSMAVFKEGGLLEGTVTCGKCGAKYKLQDVYAGKYAE
jgi:hypothetical protein